MKRKAKIDLISMAAHKGQKKVGGRQKGTPNKKTVESVKRVEYVLNLLETSIDADIKKLTPVQRVTLWNDLQEYIRPKLARTEVKHEGEVTLKQITGMEVK